MTVLGATDSLESNEGLTNALKNAPSFSQDAKAAIDDSATDEEPSDDKVTGEDLDNNTENYAREEESPEGGENEEDIRNDDGNATVHAQPGKDAIPIAEDNGWKISL